MTYTITKFKPVASMSEETLCMSAVLNVDGKPFAEIRNQGNGGPNAIYPLTPEDRPKVEAFETWAKSLPVHKSKYGDLGMDGDFIIALSVEAKMSELELKKVIQTQAKKNRTVLFKDGQLVTVNTAWVVKNNVPVPSLEELLKLTTKDHQHPNLIPVV